MDSVVRVTNRPFSVLCICMPVRFYENTTLRAVVREVASEPRDNHRHRRL